jgi:hypothetical protein
MVDHPYDLFLLHSSVARLPEVGLICGLYREKDQVLVSQEAAPTWNAPTGKSEDLAQALEKRLGKPPNQNRVALVWPSWDEELAGLCEFLSQQKDYYLSYMIVLCGPVQHEQIPASPPCKVLFIGNQDQSGAVLDTARRDAICGRLLLVLMSLGLEPFAGPELRWFGEDPSLRVVGEEKRTSGPYCAVGIEGWFPDPGRHVRSIALSLSHLLKEDFDRAAGDPEITTLKKRTSQMMSEIKDFATAGLGAGSAEWPPPFDPGVSAWRLPIVRQTAVEQIERAIERAAAAVEEYRSNLIRDLGRLGPEIRGLAAKELWRRINAEREWLQSKSSVGRLGHLLMHYYPGYSKDNLKYLNTSGTGCMAADKPDVVETARHFHHEALELAEKECQKLPTLRDMILHSVLPAVIGAGVGYAAFANGLFWWVTVMAPCLAAIYIAIRFLLWRRTAKRIVNEVASHYQTGCNKLREQFSDKIRWVRAKAALNIARQFASRNHLFGNRLSSLFDQAFKGWLQKKSEPGHLAQNPDEAVLAEVRRQIGALCAMIIREAGRGPGRLSHSRELADEIQRIANQSYLQIIADSMSGQANQNATLDLIECQKDRKRPTLAAWFLTHELDPRAWVRCLPADSDLPSDQRFGQRHGFIDDRFVNVTGKLPGPALLCLKQGLSYQQMETALSQTGIQ